MAGWNDPVILSPRSRNGVASVGKLKTEGKEVRFGRRGTSVPSDDDGGEEISSRVAGVGTSGAVCIQTIFFSFAPYRVRSNSHYYLSFENKLLDLFPRRPTPLPSCSSSFLLSFADNNFHAHDPSSSPRPPFLESARSPPSLMHPTGRYTASPIFIIQRSIFSSKGLPTESCIYNLLFQFLLYCFV